MEKRNVGDFVQIHPDAIGTDLCVELARLADADKTSRTDTNWRRCTLAGLRGKPLVSFKRAIRKPYAEYRKLTRTLNPCIALEYPKVIRYDPGEPKEHFHEHTDAWDVNTASRVVSVIAYLNDVERGGETIFPQLDLTISPRRGSVLFFPASFVFTHLARPPVSGPKYVVVSWLHFGTVKLPTTSLRID